MHEVMILVSVLTPNTHTLMFWHTIEGGFISLYRASVFPPPMSHAPDTDTN